MTSDEIIDEFHDQRDYYIMMEKVEKLKNSFMILDVENMTNEGFKEFVRNSFKHNIGEFKNV